VGTTLLDRHHWSNWVRRNEGVLGSKGGGSNQEADLIASGAKSCSDRRRESTPRGDRLVGLTSVLERERRKFIDREEVGKKRRVSALFTEMQGMVRSRWTRSICLWGGVFWGGGDAIDPSMERVRGRAEFSLPIH